MVTLSIFKSKKTEIEQINTAEAYYIWENLRIRYLSVETHQFYANLVHDRDLLVLIENNIKEFER